MHKFAKLTTATMFGVLTVGALSGCGAKADLILWTGFGASYSSAVLSLLDRYQDASGVVIEHQSQGSYDKLQSNINNSVSTASYPNIANGYPDHFAGYIGSGIQLPLDPYIKAYNQEHGGDLLADYYPEYMVENQSLRFRKDGTPYTMGLPFNKSTEVMGYNGYFVDYCKTVDATIVIPNSWQEWKVIGPKMLAVMENLYGKFLYGVTDDNGTASNFVVLTKDEKTAVEAGTADPRLTADHELLLDCEKVTREKFRLLCWDAEDNMFITLVRQWGATYTTYTAEDATKYKHGFAEYNTGENTAKTVAAFTYMKELYDARIFGLAGDISDDSYSSSGFKNNQCMFTVCSSGGLSYNISDTRFKVHTIPYYDDGTTVRKFVISQGTNLAIFDQGSAEDKQKAFDAIVALTTGDLQSAWAAETGYYPASISATNGDAYKALISNKQENPTKVAYQESAKLNEDFYMNKAENWTKFVDPGFIGSSSIRKEVDTLPAIIFGGTKTIQEVLDESYERIADYVRK